MAKVKGDIGPLLATMSVLLQLETLARNEKTLDEIERFKSSSIHALSQLQTSWNSFHHKAATSAQVDHLETEIVDDMRHLLQQVTLLATCDQADKIDSGVASISDKLNNVSTSSQVSHIEALLQASASMQASDSTRSSAMTQRHQNQLRRMDRKFDKVLSRLSALQLATAAGRPHNCAYALDGKREQVSEATAIGSKTSTSEQAWATNKDHRATGWWSLFFDVIRHFLVAVVASLVQLVPTVQEHMLTFATLLMTPRLLQGDSILLTDALNRTKPLPYEFFCTWDMCQTWLNNTFRGMPGESRVKRGAFAMFKQYARSTGPEITIEEWKRVVCPGDRVVMSVLVESRGRQNACRRCGAKVPNETSNAEWVAW